MGAEYNAPKNITGLSFGLHVSEYLISTLRYVIPVVCVTNEREENIVEQHN